MNEMRYRIDIYEMIYMYCKERNMTLQDSGPLATDFTIGKSKNPSQKYFTDGFATEKIQ